MKIEISKSTTKLTDDFKYFADFSIHSIELTERAFGCVFINDEAFLTIHHGSTSVETVLMYTYHGNITVYISEITIDSEMEIIIEEMYILIYDEKYPKDLLK